jgi:hypothetical protein
VSLEHSLDFCFAIISSDGFIEHNATFTTKVGLFKAWTRTKTIYSLLHSDDLEILKKGSCNSKTGLFSTPVVAD